jgi:hypothetical protein
VSVVLFENHQELTRERERSPVSIPTAFLLFAHRWRSCRCITFYEELMLMKEFERTENDLENKVVEAQKRYDNEQIKV